MYFRIIKPWNPPYEVTINEHVLHIQRCHTRTCIRLPGRPLLVCNTVWTCILCMWNTHVHKQSDQLPSLCVSAIDTRI